jgi:23S rRNA pseudouridine1911/1915/1917 synthase
VREGKAPVRLDLYLARRWKDFSRAQIKTFIQTGAVLVNGKVAKPQLELKGGERIEWQGIPQKKVTHYEPEDIPLDIVFEDTSLIIINKPAGMVVHPGAGRKSETLVHALLHHSKQLSGISGEDRPGIVHRLDKGTSGLLVVAKNDMVHRDLAEQFKAHTIDRKYMVVVKGVVQHDEGMCEEPIGRGPILHKRMRVQAEGKEAKTFYTVVERFANHTLLEVKLGTGRTHQIRVHMNYLGYPVVGDGTYGVLSQWINRPALHAKALGFTHPKTKKRLYFECDLPADIALLIEKLKHHA